MNWLHYLVEANIYLSVFYLFYGLFLTKETHYLLNRIYLLGSCVVSFIIPLIQINRLRPIEVASLTPQAVADNDHSVLNTGLLYVYFIGATVALVLFAVKLYRLQKLARQSPSLMRDSYKLVFIQESDTAFSFFNYLFIGTNTVEPQLITHHELVHIRQKHSVDIILLEAFRIISWFNPAIYLLQNSLKTLHEYIADEQTAFFETDPHAYAAFLVNNAYGISGSSITHSFFNYNLLKKRIIMLNQQRSGNLARLKYLVAVPICAILLCASTLAFSKTYGFIAITQQKQVPPPPPPIPPVAAKGHKAPPPPPTPPAYQKDQKAPPPPPAPPVVMKDHKAPLVNKRDVSTKSKAGDNGVKFPPPVIKQDYKKSTAAKSKTVKFPPPVVKPDN